MTRLKPPSEGHTYNGNKVPLEGVEVLEWDVESLMSRGWSKVEPPKPRSKKKAEDSE